MKARSGPNWLLRILLLISIGLHGVLLAHFSGIYNADALTYIEIALQDSSRPAARDIPRPRPRPAPAAAADAIPRISAARQPLPRIQPFEATPAPETPPSPLTETISVPAGLQAQAIYPSDRVPVQQDATAEFMTPADYLEMVRLRIESRKRYPPRARENRIQGRVAIRFILVADGSVHALEITRGARNDLLNEAALDAVRQAAPFPRPPARLFKGDLALELTIVFEMT